MTRFLPQVLGQGYLTLAAEPAPLVPYTEKLAVHETSQHQLIKYLHLKVEYHK